MDRLVWISALLSQRGLKILVDIGGLEETLENVGKLKGKQYLYLLISS